MQQFTIRDIENLCGIRAHTLRIWEQRYQFISPKRKDSNHRIYDSEDLKSLLRVSFLYRQGHKISRIAAYSEEEIQQLVEESYAKDLSTELYVNELLSAGVDLDRDLFERLISSYVLRFGIERCIQEIFIPFLERIGFLWLTNNLIPAQEHFASHILRKKIICATDGLIPAGADAPRVLLFAPQGEMHEIPLLIANYIFRKQGYQTIYFGVNTPAGCMQEYLQLHGADLIYTHLISQIDLDEKPAFLSEIAAWHKGKPLVASGSCLKNLVMPEQVLIQVKSVDELTRLAAEQFPILAARNSVHLPL